MRVFHRNFEENFGLFLPKLNFIDFFSNFEQEPINYLKVGIVLLNQDLSISPSPSNIYFFMIVSQDYFSHIHCTYSNYVKGASNIKS